MLVSAPPDKKCIVELCQRNDGHARRDRTRRLRVAESANQTPALSSNLDISDMDISTVRPAAVHILLALSDGPCHGYGILQAVRERPGGVPGLGAGSFYRHLATLIDDGLVAETAGPPVDDPRRGTYYRVTPRGRQALAAERRRLAHLIAAIDAHTREGRRGTS